MLYCFCKTGAVLRGRREGDVGSAWGMESWTNQILGFGQALRELLEVIKGFGPWKFLKSLGFGCFKRRPLRKPKSNPSSVPSRRRTLVLIQVALSWTWIHRVPSSLVLALEANAPVSPATTFEDSRRGGCSLPSQIGAGGSSPFAIVDAGHGPVLGGHPRMVLGSSPSMFERDVTGPSLAAKVVSGMGSSLEFSSDLVDSSPRTTQKEVVLASPEVILPLFLSTSQATLTATLSLTMSKPLFFYLRNVMGLGL